MVILQVDFHYEGPWAKEMAAAMQELAESINKEPGFVWKIWTEKESEQRAGGIYCFKTEETAENYLTKHRERLLAFGMSDIQGKIFVINEALSKTNQVDFLS